MAYGGKISDYLRDNNYHVVGEDVYDKDNNRVGYFGGQHTWLKDEKTGRYYEHGNDEDD